MKLKNTRRNLEILSGRDSMTVEEMLGFVHEFFRDVNEETGLTAARTPAENVELLYEHLPWLMKTSIKIAQNNEDKILDPRRKEKLDQNNEKLAELDRTMGKEEALIRQIKDSEERLERKAAELERVYKTQKDLRDKCESLKQDIDTLSHINLPEMEQRRDALLTEKTRLNTKIADLGDAILEVQKKIREQQDLFGRRQQELSGTENLKTQWTDRVKQTEQKIEEGKQQSRDLEALFLQKTEDLEQTRQAAEGISRACGELEEKIRALKSKDLPEAEKMKADLAGQLKLMTEEAARLESDLQAAREELAGMKETRELRQKDLENAAAEKERVIRDIQQSLWRIDQEKEDRARQEGLLRSKQEEYRQEEAITRSRLQEEEESCGRVSAELGKTRADLARAQEQLKLLEEDTEKLLHQLEEAALEKTDKEKKLQELKGSTETEKEYITALDGQIHRIRDELEVLKKRSATLAAILKDHTEEKESLENSIATDDKAGARLREEIRLLKQDIERKDFKSQADRLRKQKAELQALLTEFEETNNEIEGRKTDISRLEKERQNQEHLLQQLNESRLKLQTEKDECSSRTRKLEDQVRTLEEWLSSLDARRYADRCSVLSERVKQIDGIRRRVEEDWFSDWRRNNQDLHSSCTYPGEALQSNLDNMERTIQQYRDVLKNVIQCMESSNLRRN